MSRSTASPLSPGVKQIRNSESKLARTIRISVSARFLPTQLVRPLGTIRLCQIILIEVDTYQVRKVQTLVCLVSFLADYTNVQGKMYGDLPKPIRLGTIKQISTFLLEDDEFWSKRRRLTSSN